MIFVDFDDTVCLHSKTITSKQYIANNGAYDKSIANESLLSKLWYLKNKGQKIILITMSSSFMLEHKKKWCDSNCPDLFDDYIGLSIDCSKKDYISEVLKLQDKKEVNIFIDDSSSERCDVESLDNIVVYSPQFVSQWPISLDLMPI